MWILNFRGPMMKQRIVWLDSLKGFLILLVVVGHSIQEVGMHNFPGGEWIWYFIYSFHMMAFFAASGFLFYHKWSMSENKKQFLFRREFTLFVPTAILSFFSILLFVDNLYFGLYFFIVSLRASLSVGLPDSIGWLPPYH